MLKRIVLLLTFLLLTTGCSNSPETPPHQLRMNISREPPTMDPRAGGDVISSAMHFLLFEGLTRLKSNGDVTPAQASHIDISDDGLTYTFHLRGTHWSDGSSVTAQDFEAAWKKIIAPEFRAPNAHLFYAIKNGEKIKKGELGLDAFGVVAQDAATLIVQLEKRAPYFLNLISFCCFFPVHHKMDRATPNWMYEACPQFVCNGPFRLKEWKHDHEITLEKNNYYWEAPVIDLEKICVSMIEDENTALSLFEKGELDIISPIPIDTLSRYKREDSLKTRSFPGTTAICFNVHRFPFHNVHIRKAFSYAIDRSQIAQNITQLGEESATNINFFEPRSLFEAYDPIKAQYHLEIGLKELDISLNEFPTISLDYSSSEINRRLTQVLQEQWMNTLGIKVMLSGCEHRVLLDRLASKSYDFAQTFWIAQYNDPMSILERFKFRDNSKNYPGWENQDYIHYLNQSADDTTVEKRRETLAKAEALLIEEMPLAPIYHWKGSFMIKDHLTYEEIAPMGAFDYARITVKNELR